MNRSEFVDRIFRSSLLLILGGAAGVLIAKGKVSGSSDCSIAFQCRNCKLVKKCSLPEAKKFRGDDKG